MQIDSPSIRLRLKRRQVVTLPQTRGARISVHAGSAWITEDRNIEDIVLVSGQSHIGQGCGNMLIEGLEDADVGIEDAAVVAAQCHGA